MQVQVKAKAEAKINLHKEAKKTSSRLLPLVAWARPV